MFEPARKVDFMFGGIDAFEIAAEWRNMPMPDMRSQARYAAELKIQGRERIPLRDGWYGAILVPLQSMLEIFL